MNGIKKYLFIMVALAAIFGFVACSDDDDDPSMVAVYRADELNGGGTDFYTLIFNNNGTFSMHRAWNLGTSTNNELTIYEGIYDGNPTQNDTITIKIKKIADEYGNLGNVQNPISVPITNEMGRFPVKEDNGTFYYLTFTRY